MSVRKLYFRIKLIVLTDFSKDKKNRRFDDAYPFESISDACGGRKADFRKSSVSKLNRMPLLLLIYFAIYDFSDKH